jgi:hypothetical protein
MKRRIVRIINNSNKIQLEGIGVIEIILILVIIIGLVLIFREQIQAILQTAFDSINNNSEAINSEITIN